MLLLFTGMIFSTSAQSEPADYHRFQCKDGRGNDPVWGSFKKESKFVKVSTGCSSPGWSGLQFYSAGGPKAPVGAEAYYTWYAPTGETFRKVTVEMLSLNNTTQGGMKPGWNIQLITIKNNFQTIDYEGRPSSSDYGTYSSKVGDFTGFRISLVCVNPNGCIAQQPSSQVIAKNLDFTIKDLVKPTASLNLTKGVQSDVWSPGRAAETFSVSSQDKESGIILNYLGKNSFLLGEAIAAEAKTGSCDILSVKFNNCPSTTQTSNLTVNTSSWPTGSYSMVGCSIDFSVNTTCAGATRKIDNDAPVINPPELPIPSRTGNRIHAMTGQITDVGSGIKESGYKVGVLDKTTLETHFASLAQIILSDKTFCSRSVVEFCDIDLSPYPEGASIGIYVYAIDKAGNNSGLWLSQNNGTIVGINLEKKIVPEIVFSSSPTIVEVGKPAIFYTDVIDSLAYPNLRYTCEVDGVTLLSCSGRDEIIRGAGIHSFSIQGFDPDTWSASNRLSQEWIVDQGFNDFAYCKINKIALNYKLKSIRKSKAKKGSIKLSLKTFGPGTKDSRAFSVIVKSKKGKNLFRYSGKTRSGKALKYIKISNKKYRLAKRGLKATVLIKRNEVCGQIKRSVKLKK